MATQSTTIDTGAAIGWGWESVKKDLGYFVGFALLYFVVGSIGSADRNNNLWDLVGFLLSILLTCGSTAILLSYRAGKKAPLTDLFTQTKPFFPVLGATLLMGLLVGLGFLAFVVPGIILAVMWQFTVPLIIDRKLGIVDAMKESARITAGLRWSLLGFNLICIGVIILGAICLGVGLLIAMPIVSLAQISVYRTLAPVRGATA